MAEFVKAGTRAELPAPGEVKEWTVQGRAICVANVAGRIVAIDNVCIHRGGPLAQGSIERGKLVCPWHGWEFDPFTGAAIHDPQHRATVYPVKFEGDNVFLKMEAPASSDQASAP